MYSHLFIPRYSFCSIQSLGIFLTFIERQFKVCQKALPFVEDKNRSSCVFFLFKTCTGLCDPKQETGNSKRKKERIAYSKTFKGKYFNFLGYFFSIYCVWKIFISTINIIFDRVGKVDPVTRGIEIAVNYIGIQFDVKFWSQQISFLLIGIIIVTSIRGLLITLTRFFYAIASSKSSNVIVLCLAQLMGMYFVSSVLLIRMNMPQEYRSIITEVLGDLQFNFYHRWFDVIFLVSALSSIGFLYIAHKQAPEKNGYWYFHVQLHQ